MITNEPDIHRVWAAMLDDPAPPLPMATESLSAARSSARHHTVFALAAAGVAGAVVVATVGVGLAFGGHRATPAPVVPGASSVAPSPTRQLAPPPPAPGQQAADQHGKQNAALLMSAVPAGLTGLVQEASPGTPAWTWQFGTTSEYASTVYVVLTTGHADGLLSATIRGGMSDVGTDPCAPKVTKLAAPTGTGCEVVDIDGVPIGLVASHNERGQVITAIRLLAGGLLYVEAQQGIVRHQADGTRPPDATTTGNHGRQHDILGNWPALPAPPLTAQQVTALTANPGLLP